MKYFIIAGDVQQGPFSIEELSLQGITSDTLVWAEGMPRWTPAWQIGELKPLFYGRQTAADGSDSPPPPPPEVSSHSVVSSLADKQDTVLVEETQPQNTNSRRWRGGIWLVIAILGVAALVATTNPTREQHQTAIKENVTRGLSKALGTESDDLLSQGIGMIGKMIAGAVVDEILDQTLVYHNYFLFSTTSIEKADGNVTISYGAFGQVFTADKDKIADFIIKNKDKKASYPFSVFGMGDDDTNSTDNDTSDAQ